MVDCCQVRNSSSSIERLSSRPLVITHRTLTLNITGELAQKHDQGMALFLLSAVAWTPSEGWAARAAVKAVSAVYTSARSTGGFG